MSNENNVEFLYIGTISYKVYAKGMGGGGRGGGVAVPQLFSATKIMCFILTDGKVRHTDIALSDIKNRKKLKVRNNLSLKKDCCSGKKRYLSGWVHKKANLF